MSTNIGLQVSPSEVINLGRVSSFKLEDADRIVISLGSDLHTVTSNERSPTISGSYSFVSEAAFNRVMGELEAYFDVTLNAE
ncbi:MAG: hypothetical protein RPS47_18900 [Colwellia sp.]